MWTMGYLLLPMPLLGNHVPHVVAVGSKKKMLTVDARWVVAAMHNEHPFRYRPVNFFVHHAMSESHFAFDVDSSVTLLVKIAIPFDAIISVGSNSHRRHGFA